MSEHIEQAIQSALEVVEKSKILNEANTCYKIITPLLEDACGYTRDDIDFQFADSDGKFPDYTILGNTEHQWFLEAKALSVKLEDRYATQALNYANQNGSRWVVLTNGAVWQLFDNTIQKPTAEKMVKEARLTDTGEIVDFLKLISKESVQKFQIDVNAIQIRLRKFLDVELKNPDSELLRALYLKIRKYPGFEGVTTQMVASYFGIPAEVLPSVRRERQHQPQYRQILHRVTTGNYLLPELRKWDIAGSKPALVCFPDGSEKTVNAWIVVVKEVLCHQLEKGLNLPLPFPPDSEGRYFVNTEPKHADLSTTHKFWEIGADNKGRSVFLDCNVSANGLVRRLTQLLDACGVDASGFKVQLTEKQQQS